MPQFASEELDLNKSLWREENTTDSNLMKGVMTMLKIGLNALNSTK